MNIRPWSSLPLVMFKKNWHGGSPTNVQHATQLFDSRASRPLDLGRLDGLEVLN